MGRTYGTPTSLHGLLAGILVLSLGAGCGEPAGTSTGAERPNSGRDGTNGADPNGGDANSNPSDSGLASGLPADHLVSDLSDGDLGALCDAVGALESRHDAELRDFRCLALGFDGAALATDPTFTCERVRGLCDMLPLDQEIISDTCQQEVRDAHLRSACRPVTVAEFEACVVDNLALELEVASERGAMMCAEAVTWDHVLPEGTMDCACGRPLLLGPPPEDDPDRDGVPTADDRCPESEPFVEVSVYGCSQRQDSDQDGVPNHNDRCPDTAPDPVDLTEDGCSFRQRDQDDDGVLDTDDRCPDTAPGAAVNGLGCSPDQDEDGDTVPNTADACPGTEPDAAVAPNGCSARQDEDGDTVPNATDACPLTPADAAVDADGCAPEQHDAPPTLAALPEGAVTFVLAEDSPSPTRLAAMSTSVTELDEGYRIEGTLMLQLPQDGSYMILPNADVLLTYGDAAHPGLYGISGEVEAPFPSLDWFAGAEVQRPRAAIGFAPGSSEVFDGLRVPLEADRWYFWCTFDTTLGVSLGPLDLELYGNDDFRFVLDLADPFFAAQGNVDNLGFFGPIRNAAFAFSNQGRIRFEPRHTWAVEAHAQPFDGHLFLEGDIPIPTSLLPSQLGEVVIEGTAVANLDPTYSGQRGPGLGGGAGVRFGALGRTVLDINLIPSLPMSLSLTDATLGGTIGADVRLPELYATGTISADDFTFFPGIPITAGSSDGLRAAARLTDGLEGSYLTVEGALGFDVSAFPVAVPVSAELRVFGSVRADDFGVRLYGESTQSFSSVITYDGAVSVEIDLVWSGSWSITVRGQMHVDGVGSGDCTVSMSNFNAFDAYCR